MQSAALTAAAVLLVMAVSAGAAVRIPNLTRYGPPLHLNEAQRFGVSVPRRTTLEADLDAAQASLSSRLEQALSPSTQTDERAREILEMLKTVAEEAFKETAHDLSSWAVDEASDAEPDFDEVMYDNARDAVDTAFPLADDDAVKLAAGYVTAQADEAAAGVFEKASYEPSPYEPSHDDGSSSSSGTAIAVGGGALVVGVLVVVYFARRRSS